MKEPEKIPKKCAWADHRFTEEQWATLNERVRALTFAEEYVDPPSVRWWTERVLRRTVCGYRVFDSDHPWFGDRHYTEEEKRTMGTWYFVPGEKPYWRVE